MGYKLEMENLGSRVALLILLREKYNNNLARYASNKAKLTKVEHRVISCEVLSFESN